MNRSKKKNLSNRELGTREANGAGSLKKIEKEDGRTYYKYTVTYTNEFGEKYRKTFCGYSEAEYKEKQKQYELRLGLGYDNRHISISDLLFSYYYQLKTGNNIVEATYLRKLYTIQIIKESKLSDIPIIDVTIEQINAFLRSLIDDYSNSDIGKITTSISFAYELAISNKIVDNNLMKNKRVIVPKSNKKDKKVMAFTKEDQTRFLDALKTYLPKGGTRGYYRPQLYIELFTGMRMGEINGLMLEDVDLEKRLIHVRRTITKNIKSKAIVGDVTKTRTGERVIAIPPNLVPVFQEAIENYVPNEYGLLFIRKDNLKPIHTAAVNSAYKRICKKNNIPDYGQHSLRHTYATRYIENMDQSENKLVVLSRALGHKDITTTINTYADVLLEYQRDVMKEMFENTDMFPEL